jgi:hypothetical protein
MTAPLSSSRGQAAGSIPRLRMGPADKPREDDREVREGWGEGASVIS